MGKLKSPCSKRAAVAPTPTATANANIAATAYINTLTGTGHCLNHFIMLCKTCKTSGAAFSSPYSY